MGTEGRGHSCALAVEGLVIVLMSASCSHPGQLLWGVMFVTGPVSMYGRGVPHFTNLGAHASMSPVSRHPHPGTHLLLGPALMSHPQASFA